MEAAVNALDRGDRQAAMELRGGFGIGRRPACSGQQADDHLQAVQQPVIGLLAQEVLLLDHLVLLTNPLVVAGKGLPQQELSALVLGQLALVARGRAVLRGVEHDGRRRIRAALQ
jgi:hypothetical protein